MPPLKRIAAMAVVVLISSAVAPPRAWCAVSELRLKRLNFVYRFQQGKNHFFGGNYLEAAAHFTSLMNQYGELPRPMQLQLNYYNGAAHHELGLLDTAEKNLKLISVEPFTPELAADAIVRMFDIYARRNQMVEANRLFDDVSRRPWPPNLKVKIDYGAVRAYFRLRDWRRVGDLALRVDPDSAEYPRALLLAAMAAASAGELGGAEEHLKRILRMEGRLAELGLASWSDDVRWLLAGVYFDMGAYTRSLQTLSQIHQGAHDADVLYLRAWNLLMLRQYGEGLAAFRELAARYPSDQRSIEATVLGGYILLNEARFPESYAYFVTVENAFRQLAEKGERYRRTIGSREALDQILRDNERIAKAPVPPQFAAWVLDDPQVRTITSMDEEVADLGRKIEDLSRDLKRMRIISAGFGSSFENPATLERLLRNEMGTRLAEVRSRTLELMIKPVRESLLVGNSREYGLVNLAQGTRRAALDAIRELVVPSKERAVAIQRNLRRIQDYIELIASEQLHGRKDTAVKDLAEQPQLEGDPQETIGRLIDFEERLAFLLLSVMEEEEKLWETVAATIDIERQSAEMILRKLGMWGSEAYLDRLELLYRSTSGVETVLQENARLLVEIQKKILNDVIAYANEFKPQVDSLDQQYGALAATAASVRLAKVDRRFSQVVGLAREAEAWAAGGGLDVGWRLKEVEQEMMNEVLLAQRKRLEQLDTHYRNIQIKSSGTSEPATVLDAELRGQIAASAAGGQAAAIGDSLGGVASELDRLQSQVDELLRGTAWILERGGTVTWTPKEP